MKFPSLPQNKPSPQEQKPTLFPAYIQDMFMAGYTQDEEYDSTPTVACPWDSTKILLFRQMITAMQNLERRMDALQKDLSQSLKHIVYQALFTLWPAAEKIWGKNHIQHWLEQEWSTQDILCMTLHVHPHWLASLTPFVKKHRPRWHVVPDPNLSYGDLRLSTPQGGKERLQRQVLRRLSHLFHIPKETTP